MMYSGGELNRGSNHMDLPVLNWSSSSSSPSLLIWTVLELFCIFIIAGWVKLNVYPFYTLNAHADDKIGQNLQS